MKALISVLLIMALAGCAANSKPAAKPSAGATPPKPKTYAIDVSLRTDLENKIPDDVEKAYFGSSNAFGDFKQQLPAELAKHNFSDEDATVVIPILLRRSGHYEILGKPISQPLYDSVIKEMHKTVLFPKWPKPMRVKHIYRMPLNVVVNVKTK